VVFPTSNLLLILLVPGIGVGKTRESWREVRDGRFGDVDLWTAETSDRKQGKGRRKYVKGWTDDSSSRYARLRKGRGGETYSQSSWLLGLSHLLV
jgi:hypothetical protein